MGVRMHFVVQLLFYVTPGTVRAIKVIQALRMPGRGGTAGTRSRRRVRRARKSKLARQISILKYWCYQRIFGGCEGRGGWLTGVRMRIVEGNSRCRT